MLTVKLALSSSRNSWNLHKKKEDGNMLQIAPTEHFTGVTVQEIFRILMNLLTVSIAWPGN